MPTIRAGTASLERFINELAGLQQIGIKPQIAAARTASANQLAAARLQSLRQKAPLHLHARSTPHTRS